MEWLHFNNVKLIHMIVTRHFGTGPAADKAEHMLMQSLAACAGSYERHENPDEWLTRYANAECERLHNEATQGKLKSC